MGYKPLFETEEQDKSSSAFVPEAYKPLSSEPDDYVVGLQKKAEEEAIIFASEPAKKGVLSKIKSFFTPDPKVEKKTSDIVAYETYRQKKPATPEDDYINPADFASREEYKSALRGSAESSRKQIKGLVKGTLDALPEGSRKVSNWINNIIIDKPAKVLAESDFKLIRRGENVPIVRSIPGLGISPAKWFEEVADGLQYGSADEIDNLGLEVIKTTAQGTKAFSGLTGGLYEPKLAAPENMAQKFYGTFSEVVGMAVGLKAIGSGLSTLAFKPAAVTNFLNAYPRLAKVAVPLLINAGAFTAYGQLNPHLAGDFKARMKQMSLDALLSAPFTATGFLTRARFSIPASVGLGFGLAKLSGASNEDSLISGIVLGTLDAFGRTGGLGRHGFMDGKKAQEIMTKQASEILGVSPDAKPAEITKAYRKLAHEFHPDKPTGDTKKMAEINAAYEFMTGKNESFQKQSDSEIQKKQNEKMKEETGMELVEAPVQELTFGEKSKMVSPKIAESGAVEIKPDQKTQKVVSKESEPLAEEANKLLADKARMFKTADEFIESELSSRDFNLNPDSKAGKAEIKVLTDFYNEAVAKEEPKKISKSDFKKGDTLIVKGKNKGKTREVEFISSNEKGVIARDLDSKLPLLFKSQTFEVTKKETQTPNNQSYHAFVYTGNGKGKEFVSVEGKPVDIHPDGEFFTHRPTGEESSKTGWVVSEARSGLKVGEGATREKAISAAKELIERKKGEGVKLKEIIEGQVKQNGLSPRFKEAKSGSTKPEKKKVDNDVVNDKKEVDNGELQDQSNKKTPTGEASASYSSEDLPDFPVEMGGMENIKPVQFPEMVSLAKNLLGNYPTIVKKSGNAAGRFISGGGKELQIKLIASLFKDGNIKQAAMVLAHEIGHLIDYLPEGSLKRGNLLGRLHTLRNFMRTTFDISEGEGVDLKAEKDRITKEILEDTGHTFADMVTGKLPQKIKDRIKEEYQAFKKNPNFIKDAEIKKELLKVTKYWHPYDARKVPASYKAYRQSSKELYAEAISMLLNSPGLLEKMAPKFYKEFFNALDAKPEVKKQFFDLQDLLNLGEEAVLTKREADIRGMFRKGEDLFKIKSAEKDQKSRSYMSRLRYEIIDKNEALIQLIEKTKKEGKHINDDENPLYYLEEHNYLGGKIKNFVETKIDPIYKKIQEAGATWEDFGVMLFLKRVINERGDMANPLGQTPETATKQLEDLAKKFDPKALETLEKSAEEFRDAIKEVMQEGYDTGLYKPELYQKMVENPVYATFQVLDYLQEYIPASIKKQVGTLKEISNPATATVIKTISTIRAIQRNIVRKKGIDFLQKFHPEEIKPAKKLFDGKKSVPVESQEQGEELLTYMDKGQVEGVYVDEYIQKSFERNTVGHNNAIIEALRTVNSKVFRPLFITFNTGFQAFNVLRDFQRAWKNTPGMTLWQLLKLYKNSYQSAKARAFNLPDQTIQEMEKSGILSITYNDVLRGREEIDEQIDKIMTHYGLLEKPAAKSNPVLKVVLPILDFIEKTGNLVETLPKVAGYKAMNGKLPPKEFGSFIRSRIGSPDFLRRGAGYGWYNELFLFSNAIKEGMRGDYASAFTDPKTRSGYWWKTAKREFVPKLLMLAAALGLFGDDIKEIMAGVSEYDMTNYLVIPLGKDENGKSIYFRVPSDETGRILGGLFWKGLNLPKDGVGFSDFSEIASYTGGQVPSLTPISKSVFATAQYMAGQNPYDFFRGRNVLNDNEFEAGGKYKLIPFMKWQFENLGGGTLMRMEIHEQAPTENTLLQIGLKSPVVNNIIGRFIKVSDYGITERNNKIKAKENQERAVERIEENKVINKYLKEFQTSGGEDVNKYIGLATQAAFKGQLKTTRELKAFQKKFRTAAIRGESDPNVNALIYAETNDAKVALLNEYKKNMDKEEFADIFKFVQEQKIVSEEAAKKFISSLE